jgi:hypothetical protein
MGLTLLLRNADNAQYPADHSYSSSFMMEDQIYRRTRWQNLFG